SNMNQTKRTLDLPPKQPINKMYRGSWNTSANKMTMARAGYSRGAKYSPRNHPFVLRPRYSRVFAAAVINLSTKPRIINRIYTGEVFRYSAE
ncbi:hypothetical protein U1Q18_048676, partial [Sarracenia purpurea var. burkii]